MMVHWMAYCLAVGALLSAAALAVEAALRAFRRPARWVWAAALALSIAIPASARWAPRAAPVSAPAAASVRMAPVAVGAPPTVSPAPARDRGIYATALDRPLAWGWAGLSIGTALAWVAAWGALQRRRRRWRRRKVDGVRVLVSADTGPAVVGWLRGRIVLPEWVVHDADPPTRRMILQHETEHLLAGDPRMLAFGLAAVALVPWSPAAWWQLRRLRLAMEVDCDARVLAGRADVRTYAALLLEMGRRSAGFPLAAAAFSEPRSFLERRIRMMTQRVTPRPVRTSLVLAALSLAALAGTRALPLPGVPAAAAQQPVSGDTTQPVITNFAAVRRALEERYPPLLRDAGVSGTVAVQIRVTEQGTVAEASVVSTTHPALSDPAVRAAQAARFRPARYNGVAVATTITLPVMFEPRAAAAVATRPVGDEQPELANPAQVQRLIEAEYPPMLRSAGIGGQALVSIRVTAEGAVAGIDVVSASQPELGAAAQRALRVARFSPARKDGRAVLATVVLPVLFAPPGQGAAVRPAGTPVETVRRAVERYMPQVAANGTTAEHVWFAVGADGRVLAHGDSRDTKPLNDRGTAAIESVQVFQGDAMMFGGRAVRVVWVRFTH